MWSLRRLSIWSEPRKLRLRSFSVPRRDQMNVHKNAPLSPKGREAMVRSVVEGGLSKADAAYQFNTTPKTVAKWVKRFRAEGVEGLHDRSSRPPFIAKPNPANHVQGRRDVAPAAPHRQANRSRGRSVTGHCQPHPSPLGIKPDTRSRAGRAGAPL